MRPVVLGALALITALAGCGGQFETSYDAPLAAEVSQNWSLSEVVVNVPDALTVSERNRFAPNADIVWHGDPEGNRRDQVAVIVEDGIRAGAASLQGSEPVVMSVTLERFHAVTPRAVASAPAAVHNISFAVQVFDASTGSALTEPQRIQADLEANVGSAAVVAAAEGQTQKVRITNHIARVTSGWLGQGADVRRGFTSLGR
ncbi:MAG: DUF6778 family protein [Pseudomonadota bacterium]